MNGSPLDRANIVFCPYQCGKSASPLDIDCHVICCRHIWLSNGGSDLKICPFNRVHHVPVPELFYHIQRCGKKEVCLKILSKDIFGGGRVVTQSKLNVDAPVFTPRIANYTQRQQRQTLPRTDLFPKSDPQYLPPWASFKDCGSFNAVDQWLNSQYLHKKSGSNQSQEMDDNRERSWNMERKKRAWNQTDSALKKLIDRECSRPSSDLFDLAVLTNRHNQSRRAENVANDDILECDNLKSQASLYSSNRTSPRSDGSEQWSNNNGATQQETSVSKVRSSSFALCICLLSCPHSRPLGPLICIWALWPTPIRMRPPATRSSDSRAIEAT